MSRTVRLLAPLAGYALALDEVPDPVFAQGLGAQGGSVPRELLADRGEARRADPADEEVRVDAGWPGPVAVIEPGGEAYSYRAGQGDVAAVEGQASVDDVGEFQPGELAGGEGVEGPSSERANSITAHCNPRHNPRYGI